jgi:acetyl-CoA/propionyl-CoA carboxylase biotin carboxyl carrier protein
MRLVEDPADLPAALASARREAAGSFGDDTLFLERFVIRPRHIEVQVMADSHGNTLHLGERECSLQRRHQKIIEEAPSALLDDALRDRYGSLAVATAEAVGYTGAGTVEFIVSGDAADEPFFMEMNTRLQVEHPVTEMVTGLDLVELQLRVAAGEHLPITQDGVRMTGHAVEARVYAEDPARGFLPTGGVPLVVREPAGEGVRVDSSLLEGTSVGTTYDPMLSKVVAWGADRTAAFDRLDRALADTVLLGVGSNLTFLRSLLRHPEVRAGRLDTDLVERDLEQLVTHAVPTDAYVAFALHRLLGRTEQASGPWEHAGGWRPSGAAETAWRVAGPDGAALRIAVTGTPSGATVRLDGGEPIRAQAIRNGERILLTVGERTLPVVAAVAGETTWLHVDGTTFHVAELPPERRGDAAGAHDGDIRSPMPGTVVAVHVAEEDAVEEGQVLVVVEAMKMEHALTAPFAGVVETLNVRTQSSVAVDELLATVKPG